MQPKHVCLPSVILFVCSGPGQLRREVILHGPQDMKPVNMYAGLIPLSTDVNWDLEVYLSSQSNDLVPGDFVPGIRVDNLRSSQHFNNGKKNF